MPAILGEVFLAGFLDQLGHRHPLQLGDVGIARLLDLLVAVVRFIAYGSAFGGDFLGQRERLMFVVHAVLAVGRVVGTRAVTG